MDDNKNIIAVLRTFAYLGDPDRVFNTEQALRPFGDKTVSALADALGNSDADIRILAVRVLGELGNKAEPALPAMIEALKDPHRIVRICALEPVASFGAKAMDAVPILLKWIGSDDKFSHVSAIGNILMIDPSKADELIPVLVESLGSDDCVIQCHAAWLLGQLGELAVESVPALKRMVDDDDSSVRRVVGEALQEITGDATDAAVSDQSL